MNLDINNIYNMDCLKGLEYINKNSIDLVVTSPPYNIDLGNNKYNKNPYDLYNDNKKHENYIQWLFEIFTKIYEILKEGGRVCINIGDGKNGAIPTSSDIIQIMKSINYIPYTHIIWDKSQVGSRTAWGSFKSPSSPSFPTPFEHILIFAKGSKKLQIKGETDLTKDEFIEWSLALWRFPPENKQKKIGHPAMFPEELPKRCIKMLSWIGATVLDPFAGSGTTLKVAKSLQRDFIGFEISHKYYEIACKRINELTEDEKQQELF